MGALRRRLILHFTYHFVLLVVFVLLALVVGVLLIIRMAGNDFLDENYPAAAMEMIVTEADVVEGRVKLPERWGRQLAEQGMWVQVITKQGEVRYSTGADKDLPTEYKPIELNRILEQRRLNDYHILYQVDDYYESPLLFLMGIEDPGRAQLERWVKDYSSRGQLHPSYMKELEANLLANKQLLQIAEPDGKLLQQLGATEGEESFSPAELIWMRAVPGRNAVDISVYEDEGTGRLWILHNPQRLSASGSHPLFQQPLVWLGAMAGFFLLLTVVASVWQGIRYGRPLLLFVRWLERMGGGSYRDALSEKDRKLVFRKNGRLRMQFHLYREVIQAFDDMAVKLENADKERERNARAQEEWMTGISHDLRTPLASIQGYAHMLESGGYTWSGQELQEMGTVVRQKSDYMLELLEDFSLAFRLKNGVLPLDRELVELNELVRRTVLQYVNDATIQDVDFVFCSGEEEVRMMANRKWFQRMLDNLISNAVKHNPPGVRVSVAVEQREGHAVVRIEDDGVGMDEETAAHLFDRYYRGTNTDTKQEGTGLGMFIAKGIAEAHQGHIQVRTAVRQGTCFELTFPKVD